LPDRLLPAPGVAGAGFNPARSEDA